MKKLLYSLLFIILLLGIFMYRPAIKFDKLKAKYTDETSHFIEINGLQAHYQKKGQGTPLLLIHGTSSSLHTWNDWVDILSKKFTTYTIDMPGAGLTGPPADNDYSSERYVNYLNSFCDKLGLDSIYVAGNSLGGKTAWKFASQSDRVKKLVLVDPSGFYVEGSKPPLIFMLGSKKALSNLVEGVNVKPFIKKSLTDVFYDDSKITPELTQRYSDFMRRKGNRKAFFKKVASISLSDESELEQIKCPTLIQWGKHDVWLDVSLAEIYKTHIPNNKVIIYENCGHVPQEEIPVQSANDVMAFLEG